ncbi:acyl-CoA thioesterase [Kocuria sp.]|uniref:acyl-CoA thioesterase n=1 Tax=Kocuria sp. TaxID=1871328 RepID=UPI0026DFD6A4|nr:thioesterase family protein [Kocuria sp.]MDO5617819.1 thioesterase family protein [Kocuria sp.]
MRWGDMDSYGHVNNVEVVRMLEEARIAAFGVPVGTGVQVVPPVVPLFDTLPDGTQALIAEHRIKYLKALEYCNVPAPVRVWIVRAAGAALILGLEIYDAATGQICVRAHTQLAFFDPAEQRVLRLTEQQRTVLQPWSGPSLFR